MSLAHLLALTLLNNVQASVKSSTYPRRYVLLNDFTEPVTIPAQSRIECVAMGLKYKPMKNLIRFEKAFSAGSAPVCTLGKSEEMAMVPSTVNLSGNESYTMGFARGFSKDSNFFQD